MIKAALFDFDGVLTLHATGSESICNYVCETTGIDMDLFMKCYRKYNDDLLYGKTKHEDVWDQICKEIGAEIPISVLSDSFIATPIDSEMLDILKKIKSKNYKVGMVTDNKADRIKDIVLHYKWQELFDVIAVSAEFGSGKDKKDIFVYTIEKLGLQASECVFIDNTEKNLIAPKAMGMSTIYFDHQERSMSKLTKELKAIGVIV